MSKLDDYINYLTQLLDMFGKDDSGWPIVSVIDDYDDHYRYKVTDAFKDLLEEIEECLEDNGDL